MNVVISEIMCGNPNCIGVEPYGVKPPKPNIIIEDVWDLPQTVIEKAMVGLISHETIEYLLANILFNYPKFWNLHGLIGSGQSFEEYAKSMDGLIVVQKQSVPAKKTTETKQ